jgi:hypothetical protein
MSKFNKSIKYFVFASLLISTISLNSCNKDDSNSSEEEVCYTCTRSSSKAEGGGDTQYFCDTKTDAENTKIHYESLGYTCVKD